MYAKDTYEVKYQFLINKRKGAGLKHFNDPKDVYKNIDEYNPGKKHKILIFFDDFIADTISNRKLSSIVTKLFIRRRKLNVSLVFIT